MSRLSIGAHLTIHSLRREFHAILYPCLCEALTQFCPLAKFLFFLGLLLRSGLLRVCGQYAEQVVLESVEFPLDDIFND